MAGFLDRFRHHDIRNRIKNPFDEYWDRKLGVHTFGHHAGTGVPGEADAFLPFVPSTYADIFSYLRSVGVGADDVFVDLGSGYGRTVFAASWLGAKRAVGVELIQLLTDGAEANRKRSALSNRDIEFVCANALEFTVPDMTILYMFHPFGEAVLEQVLVNLKAARDAIPRPRKLRIIYANPCYNDALDRAGWLRKTQHIPGVKRPLSSAGVFDAAIWESV
jgi:SAM-dependent methyltransferase